MALTCLVAIALIAGVAIVIADRSRLRGEDAVRGEAASTVAADLAASSGDPMVDPRTAALRALAAVELDDTPDGRGAAQSVIDRYRWMQNNTTPTGRPIVDTVAISTTAYSVTEDGSLLVTDLPTLRRVDTLHPARPIDHLASGSWDGDSVLFALTELGIDVYDVVDGLRPVLRTTLTADGLDHRSVLRLIGGGGSILAVTGNSIFEWTADTGMIGAEHRITPESVGLPLGATVDIRVVASDTTFVSSPGSSESRVTFALDHSVWQWGLGSGSLTNVATFRPGYVVHSLATTEVDGMAIGTSDGLYLTDDSHATVSHTGGWIDDVIALAWSADEQSLLVATDKRIVVVPKPVVGGEAAGSQELALTSPTTGVTAFGRDVPLWVLSRADGSMAVIDPEGTATRGVSTFSGSNGVAFQPNGRLLVAETDTSTNRVSHPSAFALDPTVLPYDQNIGWFQFDSVQAGGKLPYVNAVTGDDSVIVASGMTAQGRGRIWVWDAATEDQLAEIPFTETVSDESDTPDIVTQVAIDPVHRQLIAWNPRAGRIGFWSMADWRPLGTVETPCSSGFSVSPKDQTIAVVEPGCLSDVSSSRATTTSPSPSSAHGSATQVSSSATSETGQQDFGQVVFLDPQSREVRGSADIPGDVIRVAYSPMGDELAMASVNRLEVRAADGTPLSGGPAPFRYGGTFVRLAWSPDGQRIAVGAMDQGVLVVNASKLTLSGAPLVGSTAGETAGVAWSADGAHLAADRKVSNRNGPDTSLRTLVWPADSVGWAGQLCAIAGTGFTTEEWAQEVGTDVDYRDLCRADTDTGADRDSTRSPCYPPSLVAPAAHVDEPSWVRCFGAGSMVAGGFRAADGSVQDRVIALRVQDDGTVQVVDDQSADQAGESSAAQAAFAQDRATWQALNAAVATVLAGGTTITHDGLGSVHLGMTLDAVLDADPTIRVTRPTDDGCRSAEGVAYRLRFEPDGQVSSISPMDGFGTVTPEGLAVGDSIDDVRRLYGSAVSGDWKTTKVSLAEGVSYRIYDGSQVRSIDLIGPGHCAA